MLELLIASGANVNAADSNGFTPLHFAIDDMYKSPVRDVALDQVLRVRIARLLRKSAVVNSKAGRPYRDARKETPLHTAMRRGFTETAKLLVDNGTDVNAVDDCGWMPLSVLSRDRNEVPEAVEKALVNHLALQGAKPTALLPAYEREYRVMFGWSYHQLGPAGLPPPNESVQDPHALELFKGWPSGPAPNVRIQNPNDYGMIAGLRFGNYGMDLYIPPNYYCQVYIPTDSDAQAGTNLILRIYVILSVTPESMQQLRDVSLMELAGHVLDIRPAKPGGGDQGARQAR